MSRLPAREADAEKLLACCAGVGVEMRLEEAVVVEEGKVDVRERREVMRDGCCWKRREANVRDVIVCDTNGSLDVVLDWLARWFWLRSFEECKKV